MNLITHRGTEQEYEDVESGQRFFSVSQIRTIAYDSMRMVPHEYLEAARERGTWVHRFLWQHLAARAGLLEFPPLTPRIEGYCTSIVNWAEENAVHPLLLEYKSCNRKLGYAGQVDGKVLHGKKEVETLMDGKSGVPTVTDQMQLLLYNEMDDLKSKQLLDVYFQADGSRAIEKFVDIRLKITEWPWAMSALGVLKGRINHGCR